MGTGAENDVKYCEYLGMSVKLQQHRGGLACSMFAFTGELSSSRSKKGQSLSFDAAVEMH